MMMMIMIANDDDNGDNDIDDKFLQFFFEQANTSHSNIGKQYESSGDTLTVHLHASVSQRTYGFIAEVVQLPRTGLTYPGQQGSS